MAIANVAVEFAGPLAGAGLGSAIAGPGDPVPIPGGGRAFTVVNGVARLTVFADARARILRGHGARRRTRRRIRLLADQQRSAACEGSGQRGLGRCGEKTPPGQRFTNLAFRVVDVTGAGVPDIAMTLEPPTTGPSVVPDALSLVTDADGWRGRRARPMPSPAPIRCEHVWTRWRSPASWCSRIVRRATTSASNWRTPSGSTTPGNSAVCGASSRVARISCSTCAPSGAGCAATPSPTVRPQRIRWRQWDSSRRRASPHRLDYGQRPERPVGCRRVAHAVLDQPIRCCTPLVRSDSPLWEAAWFVLDVVRPAFPTFCSSARTGRSLLVTLACCSRTTSSSS